MGPGHSHYLQALELSREIVKLLNCTSWSGVGPGLMHVATKGALEVGKPVGGLKIGTEANEETASNFHLLVDAAVRSNSSDRIVVVAFPGGIGTLDKGQSFLFPPLFLIIACSLTLMIYDSFYSKLLDFLDDCEEWGTFPKGEVASLWMICNMNSRGFGLFSRI
ncbi:hypothetical protein CFP56_032984 [Quercus suber]|uniref:Cytokinin riboside 5'-monophosphate phosphoribohydrolase n=1 Tax=Quercus suber TaxID=58331 RepID=A0AAW0JHP6_QUESU